MTRSLRYASPDALGAFVEAAAQGSFSAAARKLGKSQSTVSEAIANLEVDLGVALFDRSRQPPALTEAGRALLAHARQVLGASERLARLAGQLADGQEARLTLAMSDTYQSETFETTLAELDRRYPDLEFECMIAEDADVVTSVQRGRAQLGLLAAQPAYPPDLAHATLPERSEIVLAAGRGHPLARLRRVREQDLLAHRELRIKPYEHEGAVNAPPGRCWSAPNYLMLLEMAVLGHGWTRMPRWLMDRFAPQTLVELRAPGWPRQIAVDSIWSNQRPNGPAGAWLLQALHGGAP